MMLTLPETNMSNEEKPGCLGFIGNEILPSYYRDYNKPWILWDVMFFGAIGFLENSANRGTFLASLRLVNDNRWWDPPKKTVISRVK